MQSGKSGGGKKAGFLKPFTFDLGSGLGPCPQQLNDQAHDSKWFFLRCHCHTQPLCVLSWLGPALLIAQNSEGSAPQPQSHDHFSLPRWRRQKPHMFFFLPSLGGADRLRMNHLPHGRALVFHLAQWPEWIWHAEQRTMENKSSWQRSPRLPDSSAFPCSRSKLLAGKPSFWARKGWGKRRAKKGGENRGQRKCALDRVRENPKEQDRRNSAGCSLLMQFVFFTKCIFYTLATWCEELTHWKRPWCWERLRAGEGDNRGWDGWMASLTQWTWIWASSESWWWTGRPGVP